MAVLATLDDITSRSFHALGLTLRSRRNLASTPSRWARAALSTLTLCYRFASDFEPIERSRAVLVTLSSRFVQCTSPKLSVYLSCYRDFLWDVIGWTDG